MRLPSFSCIILLASFLISLPTFAANDVTKPNILLVIVDDMGYNNAGCYGGVLKTPNIDRLAAEGMRFTNAYSGCCVCAPARSTLMTGFHMGHNSVRNNSGGISLTEEDITFTQMIKPFGYRNGGFGKWGIADTESPGVPEKKALMSSSGSIIKSMLTIITLIIFGGTA